MKGPALLGMAPAETPNCPMVRTFLQSGERGGSHTEAAAPDLATHTDTCHSGSHCDCSLARDPQTGTTQLSHSQKLTAFMTFRTVGDSKSIVSSVYVWGLFVIQ